MSARSAKATSPESLPTTSPGSTPNTMSNAIAFGEDIAATDLPVGTELTSDYRTICDNVRNNGSDF